MYFALTAFCVFYAIYFVFSAQPTTYDPCGYVGSSNDPQLPEHCLSTNIDCCYFSWNFTTYVYYSCVSKTKILAANSNKNLSKAFPFWLNDEILPEIDHIIFVKCSNSEGVIVSPNNQEPPNLDSILGRKLLGIEEDGFLTKIWNYFVYLFSSVLNIN